MAQIGNNSVNGVSEDLRLSLTNGNPHRYWRDSGAVLVAVGQSITTPRQTEPVQVNTGVFSRVTNSRFSAPTVEFRNTLHDAALFDRMTFMVRRDEDIDLGNIFQQDLVFVQGEHQLAFQYSDNTYRTNQFSLLSNDRIEPIGLYYTTSSGQEQFVSETKRIRLQSNDQNVIMELDYRYEITRVWANPRVYPPTEKEASVTCVVKNIEFITNETVYEYDKPTISDLNIVLNNYSQLTIIRGHN